MDTCQVEDCLDPCFHLSSADERTPVYRRRGNVLLQTTCTVVFGGIMLWVGNHHGGREDHVTCALTGVRYRGETLWHHVNPHMDDNGGVFRRDSVRPHAARVRSLCSINTFRYYLGSLFAQFNPVGHLWDALGQYVRWRNPPP